MPESDEATNRSGRLLLGTHTHDAAGEGGRRQAAAMAALQQLHDVDLVNAQFRERPHHVAGIETLAVLEHSSNSVSGRPGPRKPLMSEIFGALAAAADARRARYFCFTNADIHITQEAVDWMLSGEREAYVFSREDFDSTGTPLGMELAGTDVFAVAVAWWRAHRERFRPYIAAEGVWDNVYTAVLMCHANAVLENRRPLVRHEAHPRSRIDSHFADYTRLLAARDAGYFHLWCRYWGALVQLREQKRGEDAEKALASDVFVWNPSLAKRAVQAGRNVKARVRYVWSRRQRAAGSGQ
jgi:hypothetical protein